MGMINELVRAIVPASTRVRYKLLRGRIIYGRSGTTPLSREILDLESHKTMAPVEKLESFFELKSSAWQGLQTLAYQIVLRYRPKVIVELGTHMGLSALAMGLALKELGEGGRLFAIDSWKGDPQASHYGDEVYQQFLERRKHLGLEETIVPLKMYFDEAKDLVDRPIDLLHIDGLHTWDAVNHDWETYGPLVKPGGLVLFHDVNTRYPGVTKFWRQMKKSKDCHTVLYSHGLGILRTPGKND